MATTPYTSRPDSKARAGDFGTTPNKAGALPTVKDAASDVAENVHDMACDVTDAAKHMADKVGDAVQTTKETIGKFTVNFDDMIRRNPKQAVLISVGVGCLLGLVLSGWVFNRG